MLTIHFLNVGHGDCTIIRHASGNITMIDINNGGSLDPLSEQELSAAYDLVGRRLRRAFEVSRTPLSILAPPRPVGVLNELSEAGYRVPLTDPIDFLERKYPGEPIFRYIQTHPDMDHMTGLATLLDRIRIVNFWNVSNTKTPEHFSECHRGDWDAYQRVLCGAYTNITVLHPLAGASAFAWNQNADGMPGGDGIHILSPTQALASKCDDVCDWNSLSFVLWLAYAGRKIVLPGDAEGLAWKELVAKYGTNLKADVLKASHHGRDSGYDLDAVKNIRPLLTVVSVGKKPESDASNKYRTFSDQVLSTRFCGSITVSISDDGRMMLHREAN